MPRDQVHATPRSAPLGALADFLAKSYSPERTQQMQGMAKFLDIPAISETLNRLSYGEPLTTGAGGLGGTTRFRPEVLDAAIAVAPGAGALGRLAAQGTMATGRAGARLAERVVPKIMERGGVGAEMLQGISRNTVSPMDVYHGSPYKYDKFDASKIGTGEGAQVYGHGLYFAEAPAVAQEYAGKLSKKVVELKGFTPNEIHQKILDRLSDQANTTQYGQFRPFAALQNIIRYGSETDKVAAKQMEDASGFLGKNFSVKDTGSLYKVDLPDEQIAKMLDWDKPMSDQPKIMKALTPENMGLTLRQPTDGGFMAYVGINGKPIGIQVKGGTPEAFRQKWIDRLTEFGNAEGGAGRAVGYLGGTSTSGELAPAVSNALRQAGIPGIKYLDEGSRGAGQGTRNFVTFPGEEQSLTILERNGQPMIAPAVPEEQKMLQGFYRGYAGENLDTPELFVSPQKRIADYYADKRARQTGTEPHAEMVLLDPFAGETYGHSTMGSGAKAPMFTNAKKVNIEDIEGRTQLYQSGGAVHMAGGGMVSSNHFDPIKIKQIIASLDDDYDPQRIQQIIAHQESSYA